MEEQNNQQNTEETTGSQQNLPDISGNTEQPEITPLISPIAAAFIGLIGGFFLYQIVGGLITLLIFGLNVEDAPVNSMRLMTMGGQILFILLPALLFAKMFYRDVSAVIRLRIPKWQEVLLFILGIIILTPLLQSYLYIQNHFIEILAKNYQVVNTLKEMLDSLNEMIEKTYGGLISASSIPEGIFVVAVIAVVPAICEEAMFRGFIQRSFEFKIKPFSAALITAIFFGLYHFNPYGVIPLILLGLYFGFAAYISNSIIIPVILHFLNNFAAVMLFFIFGDEDLIKSSPTGDVDIQSASFTFFGLLIVFSGVIILIKRYYSNLKT
jgi:membrane protease YdiL (CAAX protease family)